MNRTNFNEDSASSIRYKTKKHTGETKNEEIYTKAGENKKRQIAARIKIKAVKAEARKLLICREYRIIAAVCAVIIIINAVVKMFTETFFGFFDTGNLYSSASGLLCDVITAAIIIPVYGGLYSYIINLYKNKRSAESGLEIIKYSSDNEYTDIGLLLKWFSSGNNVNKIYSAAFSLIWRYSLTLVVSGIVHRAAIYLFDYYYEYNIKNAFIIFIAGNLLSVFLLIYGFVASQKVGMTFYIMDINREMNYYEAKSAAKKVIKYYKNKTFFLQASFIPWFLISYFTLGLLNIFFVIPYFTASSAVLSEYIYREIKCKE